MGDGSRQWQAMDGMLKKNLFCSVNNGNLIELLVKRVTSFTVPTCLLNKSKPGPWETMSRDRAT